MASGFKEEQKFQYLWTCDLVFYFAGYIMATLRVAVELDTVVRVESGELLGKQPAVDFI